jgi:hypothetical protein
MVALVSNATFFQFSHSQDCKMQRSFPLILALASLSLLLGCSGEEPGPPVYPVKGKVTLDGEVLAGATIQFFPEKGPLASATTDDKGEYTLNAIAGKHKVTVSKSEGEEATEEGEEDGEDEVVAADLAEEPDEGEEGGSSLVPVIYSSLDTTTLTVTVKADEDAPNDGNLDLSSS